MFVILALGLCALAASMHAALRPSRARLELVRHLARATLYSTLVGLCADLAAVFHQARACAEASNVDLRDCIVQGLGESMSPCIMGLTLLSLTALFTALGARRVALDAAA